MRPTPEKKPSARTHLAVSVPGSLMALLLIGTVAFGAGVVATGPDREAGGKGPRDAARAEKRVEAPKEAPKAQEPRPEKPVSDAPRAKPRHEDAVEPDPKPAPKDEPKAEEPKDEEPKEEPKPVEEPKDEPKEEPAPEPSRIVLEAWAKAGHAKLAWKPYTGDGFGAYKVVRSRDGQLSFPVGADDTLIAASGDRKATFTADRAPCGATWHYAVFAVRETDAGWVALGVSNVASVFVPCEDGHEPKPKPTEKPKPPTGDVYEMWFEAGSDGGKVFLHWEACGTDGFAYYKIVRSATNPNPTYPANEGTEKVAAIGDHGATSFVDKHVEPGQAFWYRVVSVAHDGTILGQTPAVRVEVHD